MASLLRTLLPAPLLLWSAISSSIAEEAPHHQFPGADDVRITRHGEAFHIEVDMFTLAPAAKAWLVLTDFEHMAAFIPNLERSRVVERKGNHLRIEQQGKAWFGPFSISFGSIRDIELLPPHEIRARQVGGTAKAMASTMRLIPTHSGTRLEYRADLTPDGGYLPQMLGPAAIRHETAEQFSALLREIQRR